MPPAEDRRDPSVTSLILRSLDDLKLELSGGFSEMNRKFDEIGRLREADARQSGAHKALIAGHETRITSLEKWRIATLTAVLSGAAALILTLFKLALGANGRGG